MCVLSASVWICVFVYFDVVVWFLVAGCTLFDGLCVDDMLCVEAAKQVSGITTRRQVGATVIFHCVVSPYHLKLGTQCGLVIVWLLGSKF